MAVLVYVFCKEIVTRSPRVSIVKKSTLRPSAMRKSRNKKSKSVSNLEANLHQKKRKRSKSPGMKKRKSAYATMKDLEVKPTEKISLTELRKNRRAVLNQPYGEFKIHVGRRYR